jgi:succinyl-CoA synthetase beta subunit
VDIEEVAASDPAAVLRAPIDLDAGIDSDALSKMLESLRLYRSQGEAGRAVLLALWKCFLASDASLLEINPLIVSDAGKLFALDAKLVLDDNALYRHPDLAALRDESQEHPLELKAGRAGISYVGLDGNIGCLVNGAGLAMATNDIIKISGGSPANFLDVGGGANVEQVTKAFSIILEDTRVKAILVNIFGGIMRCDWIAQGLLNATEQLEVKVPIVVRLEGTNVEEGRRLLGEAKRLNVISINDLAGAALRVVGLARTAK